MNTSFLCESCGYNLDGSESEPGARCPECGKPIAESLPAARPGSPWQQKPGLFTWGSTVRAALFRPTGLYQQASMASVPRGFLILNLLLTSALIVAPFTGVFIGDWARSSRGQGPVIETLSHLSAFAAQTLVVAGVLFALTLLDVYGIQLLARTRGWRLTNRAAWVVCSHATVGWLLAGVLPLLFMANYYIVGTLLKVDFTGQVSQAQGAPRVSWQGVLGIGLPVAGYLGGLIAFELIALKGARTCRYANTPAPGPVPLPA